MMRRVSMEDSITPRSAVGRGQLNKNLLFSVLFAISYTSQGSYGSHDTNIDPEETSQAQQGSWSHWWSYDGISGPDYWHINKQWRLCALGRKQSPVNVRTDRLLYDHLLGPLRLNWHERRTHGHQLEGALASGAGKLAAPETKWATSDKQEENIRLKLINSGRGVEVLLEAGAGSEEQRSEGGPAASDHLHLSHGPLSYEYKLFKIELHSAASSGSPAALLLLPGSNLLDSAPPPAPAPAKPPLDAPITQLKQTSAPSDHNANKMEHLNGAARLDDNDGTVPEALRVPKTSEHLIEGRAFDGELQLHFYNTRLASSGHEAQRLANEQPLASLFAVISVFISLADGAGEQDNSSSAAPAQPPLGFILDNLAFVPNQGDALELRVSRQQIDALITDPVNYITYQGSLNRPPCAENVDWILLNRAIRLEPGHFANLFQKLNTNQDNVRPVRQLNGRLLRTSISFENLRKGADSTRARPLDGSGQRESSACNEKHDNCPHANGQAVPSAGRQRHCNMKPNFAYHFTFEPGGAVNKPL